jgi:hypothetical protein
MNARKFRAWAVDLEYTDGERVTAYWDFTAGVHWWNYYCIPSHPIQEICVPNESYKNKEVRSYSDVYVVEITRTPRVEETIRIERV